MSSSTTKGENKRGGLPEDDSLAAFAGGAFPARSRRRRSAEKNTTGEGSTTAAADTGAADTAGEEQAAPQAPTREAQAPKGAQEPSVAATAGPPEEAGSGAPAAVQAPPQPAAETVVPAPATEPEPPRAGGLETQAPGRQVARREPAPAPAVRAAEIPARDLGAPGQRATQCTVMVSADVRERFARYQLAKKMEKGREPTNAIVVRRAVLHAKKHDLFARLLELVRHEQQPIEEDDYDADGLFGDVPGRRAERGRMKDSVQQSFRPSFQELEVIDAITSAYGFPSRSDFLNAALDAFLDHALPARGGTRTRGK